MSDKNKSFFNLHRLLTIVATMVITGFILTCFLPTILSTNWGKEKLVGLTNHYIPGSVEIKSLDLSWFGPQSVEGITLKDPSDTTVATISSFTSDSSLFSLLLKKISFGLFGQTPFKTVQIAGLNATITEEQPGLTNLQRALINDMGRLPRDPTKSASAFKIGMANVNASIRIASSSDPIHITLQGQTKQGELLGDFDVAVQVKGVPSDQLDLVAEQGEMTVKANIKNFPVAILDYLIALKNPKLSGLATAALGKTLNLKANNTISPEHINFSLDATTATFSTTLTGQFKDHHLVLKNLGAVSFIVTPELLKQLSQINPAFANVQLNQPAAANLTLQEFSIPLTLPATEWLAKSALKMQLTMSQASATLYKKPVELHYFQADLQIPQKSDQITALLSGDLLSDGNSMHFNLSGSTNKPETFSNLLQHVTKNSECKVELNNFPISFLDDLLDKAHSNLLTTALGHFATVKLDSKFANNQANLNVSFKSDQLTVPNITLKLHEVSDLRLAGQLSINEAALQQEDLVKLIGSTINVDISVEKTQIPLVDITVTGTDFKAEMALALGSAIELQNKNNPGSFTLTITPERLHVLRRLMQKNQNSHPRDSLQLVSPAIVIATISSLNIPWNSEKEPHGWTTASITAEMEIDGIKIKDIPHNQSMSLEKISAQIDSQNISKQIRFNAYADEITHSRQDNETEFGGVLENAFTANGEINKQNLSLQLEANSKRLPVALLTHLISGEISLRNKVEALFGPTMDTNIKVALRRMNGPIQATLQGKNGRMDVDALLSDGLLTLKNPIDIQVAVTPQLGKSILQDVVPVLSGAIASDYPIKISVDPKGFSIPIRNWDIEDINIGRATIDLGKIQFTNQGELGNIFALLNPSAHENLSVWFTPLYLEMSDGVIELQRMDMLLLSRYPIALWGKINFPRDKVDLTIGISAIALKQAIDLEDLDQEYMMQIPLKGSIGDASIDKTKAASRISALVAQNQSSPHAIILGTVLDIATGGLTEGAPPEPTTRPFPWGDITVDNGNSKPKSKSKEPRNAIEKGASNLLESLFK